MGIALLRVKWRLTDPVPTMSEGSPVRKFLQGASLRPGTLKVKGAVYRAIAVAATINSSPLTAEQLDKTTTLAAAKPMAMNIYKLDLAKGLIVCASQQVA